MRKVKVTQDGQVLEVDMRPLFNTGKTNTETVQTMRRLGYPPREISRYTGIKLSEVQAIIRETEGRSIMRKAK